MNNIWILIAGILTIGQGVFQIFLILTGLKKKNISVILLSLILLFLAISTLEYSLVWSGFVTNSPHFIGFTFVFQFLFPPLIYLFFRSEIKGNGFDSLVLLHFIPFIIILGVQFPFLASSATIKITFFENQLQSFLFYSTARNLFVTSAFILQAGVYAFAISKLGHLKIPALTNIKFLFYIYLLFSSIYLAMLPFNPEWISYACLSIILISTAFIYLVSYLSHSSQLNLNTTRQKYSYSSLNFMDGVQLMDKLDSLMSKELLFTDPDLKISEISTKIGASSHHVSQAINQTQNVSFRAYVNNLRIQYAISKIHQASQKVSLKEIYYSSGFNNKTTFTNSFKERIGLTPSQYARQVLEKRGKEL